MHIFLLVVLSGIAGALYVYGVPRISGYIPASITANPLGQVVITGAFILLTVGVAGMLMKAVFKRKAL